MRLCRKISPLPFATELAPELNLPPLFLKLAVVLLGMSTLLAFQIPDIEFPQNLTENPLPFSDQQKAQDLVSSVKASEWLGPLAPIAISPFFGITCLAAISQFGGDYVPVNSFVSTNPVLNNPTILWVFLGLTVLTSLPRLTKVSKPAAQAIDQLETYAGIITILIIRFLPGMLESSEPATAMVVQMGVLSFSADVLLGVAAVINIVVINSVKFFFEVMVWLIPVPFVDAALEVANKTACAGLMAIYAWSPLAATGVNLLLFLICLVVFRWVNRRVTYLRSIIGDPVWSLLNPKFGVPKSDRLTVFTKDEFESFPAKTKLVLQSNENGWRLIQPRFLMSQRLIDIERSDSRLIMREGLMVNSLEIMGPKTATLLFSRRYLNHVDELAKKVGAEQSSESFNDDLKADLVKT